MASNDKLFRFTFENSDIRGEIIHLNESYQAVLKNGAYPDTIAPLMGEFLAAAGLLSATMKFDGVITLQARGEKNLSLIMADCTRQNLLRGIIRHDPEQLTDASDLRELLGNGHLAITIDPAKGERYQGIVPLTDSTLAGCLTGYFELSEQLPTRIWLASNGETAAGLLLQALPVKTQTNEERADYWQHLTTLTDTLTDAELLALEPETILTRLYHQEQVRLYEPRDMAFGCSCSQVRTAEMLISLGREEVNAILEEQGSVDVDCQFCHQHYSFDQSQIDTLFSEEQRTLH